jgi:putative ABC transport system permease protein
MNLFDGIRRAVHRPAERLEDVQRDLDDELSFHLAMREERLRAGGLSADDATREAQRQFGDIGAIRAACVEDDRSELRRRRVIEQISDLARDVRIAMRTLRRSPVLAVGAASLLALGIGGTTAVFSILNAIYFRPLPYPQAERLAAVSLSLTDSACARGCLRAPTADEAARLDGVPTVESAGTLSITQETIELPTGAFVLEGAEVSREIPALLGLRAAVGRSLTADDFADGAAPVLVLGHGAWVGQFGGDSAIVGQAARVGDRLFRIVGVLGESSELGSPIYSFNVRAAQYLVPAQRGADRQPSQMIARLRAGSAPEAASAAIDARLRSHDATASWHAVVVPLRTVLSDRYRGSFALLLGAIAVVLSIICLNVTGLLVARLNERMPEMATRAVLGAGRIALVRLIATETLAIAAAGGAGGLLIGYWATTATRWLPLDRLPFWTEVRMDLRVVAFGLALTTGAGLVLSVMPILALSPSRVAAGIRGLVMATPARARLRGFIVAAEVALSVVLLAAAATLMRQLIAAEHRDLGWAKQSVVYLSLGRDVRAADGFAWMQRIQAGLRPIPGVAALGVIGADASRSRSMSASERLQQMAAGPRRPSIVVEGRDERITSVHFGSAQIVSDEYFDAIGTRIVSGRAFSSIDNAGAAPAAIVNASAAARLFPGTSAIGKRFRIDAARAGDWLTIVGIAADESDAFASTAPARATLYRPMRQVAAIPQSVIVRVSRDTRQMAPIVRDALHSIDRSAPIASVLAIEDGVAQRMWTARFNTDIFLAFAALAMVLACLGVYATVSYTVARRRRELAIRLAVGADALDVIVNVLGAINRAIVPGLAIGAAGAIATSRFLRSLLYGSNGLSAPELIGVLLAIWLAALAAAYLPARRAAATDATLALRAD